LAENSPLIEQLIDLYGTKAPPQPRTAELCIASGSTDPAFAEKIARELGTTVVDVERRRFSDGELFVRFEDSLREADVFLIQSHSGHSTEYPDWSPNDAVQEHIFMTDAAIGASATHTTVVAPYFGYSRQDKKDDGRVPIGARRVVRQFLGAGAERLISMDLHAPQIQGFTNNEPFENLFASHVLLQPIKEWAEDKNPENIVVVAPDAGRAKLNRFYRSELNKYFGKLLGQEDYFGVSRAVIDKDRAPDSTGVIAHDIVGDVAGKHCVVVDDMIDTAKTLRATGDAIMNLGAESAIVAATHAVFSGDAPQHLANSAFERIIVTDTIPQSDKLPVEGESNDGKIPQLTIETVAPLIAEVIWRIHHGQSVSVVFGPQRAAFGK
jgi:ribose-phosphate pyrophosphokinase